MLRVVVLAAACCAMLASKAGPGLLAGPAFSFRGSGQIKQEEVAEILKMEEEHDTELLEKLEQELGQMYASLPKNEHGNIGHQTVRYALHRFFVKRHGWFIRGLEPDNATWTPQRLPNGELPPAWVKEWVPNFLQEKIEHHGHHGMSIRDLAEMAATMEDLVFKEVGLRLKLVYQVHGEPLSEPLPRATADELLGTFYMTFLLANNLTGNSTAHLLRKKKVFARKYRGYKPAHEWFENLVNERLGSAETVDLQTASTVVNDIGLKYHTFNEAECNELRTTLQKMESRKPGRVRLSVFYNMSRFTHWRFTEKPEYLKTLGALDDTDPSQLSLITANYVMARPNCLDASNLYTLCCTNACEDLMGELEREIGNSTATPEQITGLVSQLASDLVPAPRVLSSSLVGRLDSIALYHGGGVVPLHGRLFAQWMHHAYPRECPYPHESGRISPQTAEEWSRAAGSSEQSSDEERQKFVDGDVCMVTPEGRVECGDELGEELPWNPAEELLTVSHHIDQPRLAEDGSHDVLCLIIFCMFITSLVLLAVSNMYRTGDPAADCQRQLSLVMLKNSAGVILSVAALFLVLATFNLLDESVFVLALGVSFVFYLTSVVAKRNKSKAMQGKLVA